MNCEEKYNAALERASKLKVQNPFDTVGQMVEHIFPELKENENEKIRKDILCYFEHYAHDIKGADEQKWIAWLKDQKTEEIKEVVFRPVIGCDIDLAVRQAIEKQRTSGKDIVLAFNGAYIPVSGKTADDIVNEYHSWIKNQGEQINPYSGISFEYDGHTWGMCARDNGVEILFDGELKAFLSLEKSFIYPIYPQPNLTSKSALEAVKEEKIDNQNCVNPADKVEPKFHEGEWLQYRNAKPFFVEEITKQGYVNGISCLPFDWEDEIHLWSIDDAKRGDVLVDAYGNIGIFDKCYFFDWMSCCSLGNNGGFQYFTVEHENEKTYPATKEQRDLFFSKMKEEGWEWDSENKELKKTYRTT